MSPLIRKTEAPETAAPATRTLPTRANQRITSVPLMPLIQLAKNICPTDDIRYYLNGVYVDLKGVLVATNGHMAMTVQFDRPEAEVQGDFGIIVPYTAIAAMQKHADFPSKATLQRMQQCVEIKETWQDAEKGTLSIALPWQKEDALHTGPAVDGRYPDWRRVMPPLVQGHTGMPAQVNADYVAAIKKAVTEMAGKKPDHPAIVVYHAGDDRPVQIVPTLSLSWQVRAIVMPIREKMPVSTSLKAGADKLAIVERAEEARRTLIYIFGEVDKQMAKTAEASNVADMFNVQYRSSALDKLDTALIDLRAVIAAELQAADKLAA